MTDIVEKVARAICLQNHGGYPVNMETAGVHWTHIWWPEAVAEAIAAIAVLKEEGWTPPETQKPANP